jgi:hypothetical protein
MPLSSLLPNVIDQKTESSISLGDLIRQAAASSAATVLGLELAR